MSIIVSFLIQAGLGILARNIENVFPKIKKILGLKADAPEKEVASALENMSDAQLQALLTLQYHTVVESEVTKRLEIDNAAADSWLTRHIRPLALGVLTVFYMLFITFCAIFVNNISKDVLGIIEVINQYLFLLLTTVYGFYFGGRTFEKTR